MEIKYCEKCDHTGYIRHKDEQGYEYLTYCECFKPVNALKRLYNEGLGYLLEKCTFDRFETNKDFQKIIYNKAKNYVEEDNDKWFTILAPSGCVDCDTEYFNGTEWKRIADYSGEKVLQYNPQTKEANLIQPYRYIRQESDKLYQINTIRGSINMCLSADHNFAYEVEGKMYKKPFSEIMEAHNKNLTGFNGRIETAFNYSGKGIELTENEIRLMCAVMADGNFLFNTTNCRVNVKKERKKERMRFLLQGYNYKEYKKPNGYSVFNFYAPRREKEFTDYWYNCNNEQLKIIADEVINWDGSISGKRKMYFTTSKKSADFIQFVFSATGHRSTIAIDKGIRNDDRYRKPCYIVNCVSGSSFVSMVCQNGKTKATITEVKPKDNKQYCFTVETGYLVLRRNGRIFITGNCGKTHICISIMNELIKQGKECYYIRWNDFVSKLNTYVNTEAYFEYLDRIESYEVLYIDDFLKPLDESKPTQAELKKAYELIDYRVINRKKTIISSERTKNDLIEIDEAIAGRINEMSKGYLLMAKGGKDRNYRYNKEVIL